MTIRELFLDVMYRIILKDKRIYYYLKLKKNLNLDRESVVKYRDKNLRALIMHAYNNTSYYKDLFDELNINPRSIKNKNDLKSLPELTKSIIINNIDRIKSNDNYGKELKKYTSGGSTGFQAVIYKSKFYQQMESAAWLRNNSIVGWNPNYKSAWIWGSPIENAKMRKSVLARIGMIINRRLIFNAYNYSLSDFEKWYLRIKKYEPKVIFGYSSILAEFSHFIIEQNLILPSVGLVVSTTEKLTKRNIISEAFNCPVYDQYGCREVLSVAIETKNNNMIQTDDICILNNNINNEILMTPLYSYGFPLINYKVGDIGEIDERNIDASLPFPNMNLKIGRITENFINNKGENISSSALSVYFSTFDLRIDQHQIVQKGFF